MSHESICISGEAVRPYLEETRTMIGDQLGSNYISSDEMTSVIRNDTDKHLVMVMPDKNGKKISEDGIPVQLYHTPTNANEEIELEEFPDSTVPKALATSVGFQFKPINFAPEIELQGQAFPKVFQGKKMVGLIDGTAVREGYARKGYGELALNHNSDLLLNKGCDILCAWGWRNARGVYAAHVFRAAGFRAEREYRGYWENESRYTGFHCPSCGPPPCRCSAILYVKE